jgi:hypothetical protein
LGRQLPDKNATFAYHGACHDCLRYGAAHSDCKEHVGASFMSVGGSAPFIRSSAIRRHNLISILVTVVGSRFGAMLLLTNLGSELHYPGSKLES